MKKFLNSIVVAACLLFGAQQAHAKASVGVLAGTPELAGVYISGYPTDVLSVDGWLTLATVDGGLTGHIPLSVNASERHNLIVTGMGGYVHDLVGAIYTKSGGHAVAAVGYEYQNLGGVEIRLQAGADILAIDPVDTVFHGHASVGYLF